jgi:predicted ribonuclease YlaK
MTRKNKVDSNIVGIYPKSSSQAELIGAIASKTLTVVEGCAGSGKTLLSAYSLYELYRKNILHKIVVIRLVADTFGEKIGALPGTKDEKVLPYLSPILDNLQEFLSPAEYKKFISEGLELLPVSYSRGRSLHNTGIIIEECQNMTPEMVICILTRMGRNTKVVANGSLTQTDFKDRNGMVYLIKILEHLQAQGEMDCALIKLPDSDGAFRNPLIPSILKAHQAWLAEG